MAAGFLAAVARRAALPPAERFRVPVAEWLHAVRSGFLTPGDAAVNGLLAAAVLAATVGVGVAFVAPPAAESVTTLGLYTPGPDGPVASDYPAEIPAGESADLVARVENQEGRPVTYTLVVEVQRVRPAADGLRVLEERVVERVTETVSDTGTWTHRHALASPLRGGDLRVVYYLYEGDAPRDPDADSADRYVAFRTSSPA